MKIKMRALKTMLLLAATALAGACVADKRFDLVRNGSPACSIVLAPQASPSAQLAAGELAAYVQKISGAALPITNSAAKNGIVIGTLESLADIPETVRARLAACASDEAFYIKTAGGNIFIVGKKPIGVLYGAYTLLEDYLGVRWFYPGALGESCPGMKTIRLPEIDDFQQPDMAARMLILGVASYNFYDAYIWCARHKMQLAACPALRWFEAGRCTKEKAGFLNQALNTFDRRGGHDIFALAVPDSLFKAHPEYFTLRDGKRDCSAHLQRCLANPEVFKLVAEYGLQWCRANSNNVFMICSQDSRNSWCECAECRRLGTVNGKFKVANLYHRFFSRVVSYILERDPEARIDVYFYIDYGVAPDDRSIHYRGKNVRGIYCTCFPHARCYAHGFSDPRCARNRKCLADLREVLRICPRVQTYEYLLSSRQEYAPVHQTIAQDIKDLAALGVEGFMADTVPMNARLAAKMLAFFPNASSDWQAGWPAFYLSAKLHWNTALDPEQIMDAAYGRYYGPAAPAMKKYQALRLRLWQNAPGHVFYGGPRRTAYCLTVPGAEKELRACLAAAKKLAGDDKKVLERIGLDEKFLDMFWKTGAAELEKQFAAEKQIIPERVREQMTIDGDLSEQAWLSARPVAAFCKVNTQQPPAVESSFRLAYDDANLYVGFVAVNAKALGPEIAKTTRRDNPAIQADDHIELEFAPPDGDGRFYHICVNTRGMLYDAMMLGQNSDPGYDSQAEIKVKKLADRFVYEIRLPLAPMRAGVAPGKVWGLSALRRANNLPLPENREDSSLDGNYPHRVMEFRQVVFGDNVVKNGNFSALDEKTNAPPGAADNKSVKHWGIKAKAQEVLDRDPRPARLRVQDGVIYSFFNLPGEHKAGTLLGELHAAGAGKITLWTSTCLRPPDEVEKPFTHSIRKEGGTFDLPGERGVFRFAIDLAPDEYGYLFISVAGEALISHVSGVLAEKGGPDQ